MDPDALFLQIASEIGHPPPATLQQLRASQAQLAQQGQATSLYQLACSHNLLSPQQAQWFVLEARRRSSGVHTLPAKPAQAPAAPAQVRLTQPEAPASEPEPTTSSGVKRTAKRKGNRGKPGRSSGSQARRRASSGSHSASRRKASSGSQAARRRASSGSHALPRGGKRVPKKKVHYGTGLVIGGAALFVAAVVGAVFAVRGPGGEAEVASKTGASTGGDPAARAAHLAKVRGIIDESMRLASEGQAAEVLKRLENLRRQLEGDPAAADALRKLKELEQEVALLAKGGPAKTGGAARKARKSDSGDDADDDESGDDDDDDDDDASRLDPTPDTTPTPRRTRDVAPPPGPGPGPSGKRTVTDATPGGLPAVHSRREPVPPLGPSDAKLIGREMSKGQVASLVARFVDRAERAYTKLHPPPEGFLEWIGAEPKLRAAFWLALDPVHDRVGAAIRVLNRLRLLDGRAVSSFVHLAVAFAVVWDQPAVIEQTRRYCIFGMKGFEPLPTLEANFKHFTAKKNQRLFQFRPDKLVWPTLVYVVNMDLTPREIRWGIENYMSRRAKIGKAYHDLKYDDAKRAGRTPALGSNTYNLPNLRKYGGVCGDQSHFASRLAKVFCIPATKVWGAGRFGGETHAWYGALASRKGRPVLEFSGRYLIDMYYTGKILDPQTRRSVLDREVSMMLEGAGLSYPRYVNSLVLTRIARGILEAQPKRSLDLTINALKQNHLCAPAWLMLMEHVKRGTAKPKLGIAYLNKMFKLLAGHPDLTLTALDAFMGCVPKDEPKKRNAFYETASRIYAAAARPDLHIALAHKHVKELIEQEQEAKALSVSLNTAAAYPKEGARILELVKRADALARKHKRLAKVVPVYMRILGGMPKKRGEEVSTAYRAMAKILVAAYETLGDSRKAKSLRESAGL